MKPVNGEEWKGSRIRNSQGEPPPKKIQSKREKKMRDGILCSSLGISEFWDLRGDTCESGDIILHLIT